MSNLARLRSFIAATTRLIESERDEAALLNAIRPALGRLIAEDDWLPDAYAQPHALHYQQYLLYADPLDRLSVVSFVWGPGQATPIHDHRVWGLVGVLRGAELSRSYVQAADGRLIEGPEERLERGAVAAVSPTIGDVHRISNAHTDRVSISIHVYGGNIGAIERSVFDPVSFERKPFISRYSNATLPNLWNPALIQPALSGAAA